MYERELTCIVCPRGCSLKVTKEDGDYKVTGNSCKRGVTYGVNEVVNPVRQVTSTVKLTNARQKRLPVITDRAIAKELIFETMDEINKITVEAPVQYGDIIIKNILDTDVNIIASRSID